MDIWIDRVEGKKVFVKGTLSAGAGKYEGTVFDEAESMIINIAGKKGVVTSDLKDSIRQFNAPSRSDNPESRL